MGLINQKNKSKPFVETKLRTFLVKHFGDRTFIREVLKIIIPAYLSAILFSLVSFLDNFMIGALGSDEAAAVNISNQFFFLWGATAQGTMNAVAIFISQFYGANKTFRVSQCITSGFWLVAMTTSILLPITYIFAGDLAQIFTTSSNQVQLSIEYSRIVVFSWIPATFTVVAMRSFQSQGITVLSLVANMASIVANVVLNRALIYGDFGGTPLGVKGAAYATLASRFLSLFVILTFIFIWKRREFRYIFWPFIIDPFIVKKIFSKSLLLVMQFVWSFMAITQNFFILRITPIAPAVLGAVGAIQGLFFSLFSGISISVNFLVGKELGKSNFEKANSNSLRLMKISGAIGLIISLLTFIISWGIPKLYTASNIDQDEYESLIRYGMWIIGGMMPIFAINMVMQSSLRSGGSIFAVSLDSILMNVTILLVISLVGYLSPPHFLVLYLISKSLDIFKTFFLGFYYRRKIWHKNLTL